VVASSASLGQPLCSSGFERADDAVCVPRGVSLATSRDFISPLWYRDRIRMVQTEQEASDRVVRDA